MMTAQELADILSGMWRDAPEGEAMAMIHLFGIIHVDEINSCGESVPQIVRLSDVPDNHVREVYKGMKLSRYVSVKPNVDFGQVGV